MNIQLFLRVFFHRIETCLILLVSPSTHIVANSDLNNCPFQLKFAFRSIQLKIQSINTKNIKTVACMLHKQKKQQKQAILGKKPSKRRRTSAAASSYIAHPTQSTVEDNTNSFAQKAFSAIEEDEAEKLVDTSSWLPTLLSGVESVPIAFSLASATKPGFPLVYVNKQFELLTGYPRAEVLGQSCQFLVASPMCPKTSATP